MTRRLGREIQVEIGNTEAPEGGGNYAEHSTNHYVECVRQDRLSWLLFDGSIVQVSYRLRGTRIVFHRYCYIPAPFDADLRAGLGLDISEWIESASVSDPLSATHRSALRFEYDPDAATEEHPAAHLHLNSPKCRIPMRGPISARDFVSFMITFLYPGFFERNGFQNRFEYDATISEF